MKSKLTKPEIKSEILKIIKANQYGVNEYEILSLLSKNTEYVYDKGFHQILYEVARDNDIRVENNVYYLRNTIMVEMKIEGALPLINCYHCEALKKIADACSYGIDRHDKDNEHMCALNPSLRFTASMNYIPKGCPVNIAYMIMKANESKGDMKQ